MTTIGTNTFLNVAHKDAHRITVEKGDLVAGAKKGLWDRFTGWITGRTAQENRAAYQALRDAVTQRYGPAGLQAFEHNVGDRMEQGRRLHPSVVRCVLIGAAHPSNAAADYVRQSLLGQEGDALSEYPMELWTNKSRSPDTEGMDFYQICWQVLELDKTRDSFLASRPEAERALLAKRLDQAVDIARTALAMKDDKFKASYAEGLTHHIMGIRAAGIPQRFPGKLTCPSAQSGNLYDENGKLFDNCRGPDSHVVHIDKYMIDQGLSQQAIAKWAEEQGQDSWTDYAQAFKYMLAQQRDVPLDNYWMGVNRGGGHDVPSGKNVTQEQIKQHFEKKIDAFCEKLHITRQQLLQTIQIWHALNMEFLAKVDIPGSNREDKTLTLYRTEPDSLLTAHNLQPKGSAVLKRGPAESGSILAPVVVFSNNVTIQTVPHHRIIAGYCFERAPNSNISPFLGDPEKEFLFMPEGIEATYLGKLATKPIATPLTKPAPTKGS